MPELPEVEIGARNLRKWLRGRTIERVVAPRNRITRGSFARALVGRKVVAVDRRGKWVRIRLDDGTRAFSHFGMSGLWVRRPIDAPAERSERLRIDVGAHGVRYVDPRMFGRFVVAKDDLAEWNALGPDPLIDGIDVERLARELARRRKTIKEALLDQRLLAGIGNIQATEALWRARIDPRARTEALHRRAVSALARALRWSIDRTLAAEEGPEIAYVDAGGPNPFVAYGRAGEACPRCRTPFVRIVLGGRGTTYCPRCQAR